MWASAVGIVRSFASEVRPAFGCFDSELLWFECFHLTLLESRFQILSGRVFEVFGHLVVWGSYDAEAGSE